eukprot:12399674-Karenia_brevis.AAC.2
MIQIEPKITRARHIRARGTVADRSILWFFNIPGDGEEDEVFAKLQKKTLVKSDAEKPVWDEEKQQYVTDSTKLQFVNKKKKTDEEQDLLDELWDEDVLGGVKGSTRKSEGGVSKRRK